MFMELKLLTSVIQYANLLSNKKPPRHKFGGLAIFQFLRIKPEDP